MFRCSLFVLLILFSLAIVGAEILRVGKGRRAGEDEKALFRRFRRRAKGVVLLNAMFLLAAWYDEILSAHIHTAGGLLLYVGLVVILMFWLLILAARDLRETVTEATEQQQTIALQALVELEEEIVRAREERKAAAKDPPK